MVTKYQLITELYNSTINKITATPSAWTEFLRSACRNYKCRFDEQILIYAQRPDATAVLEIEKWNEQFGRWVNKGARGIAVFDDEHNGNYRLKHYFDIADTHGSRFERPVPIWQMEPDYEAEVIESLENSFGNLEDKATLAEALISAAQNAVDDNYADYSEEFNNVRDGSGLENMGIYDAAVVYHDAIYNSVAYMLLTRCGIDADKYINVNELRNISDFNTRETVNVLGAAASDITEMCLREISATVRNLQRREDNENRTFAEPDNNRYNIYEENIININDERSFENDRNINIPDGGRLSGAEPERTGGESGNSWQIRVAPNDENIFMLNAAVVNITNAVMLPRKIERKNE